MCADILTIMMAILNLAQEGEVQLSVMGGDSILIVKNLPMNAVTVWNFDPKTMLYCASPPQNG